MCFLILTPLSTAHIFCPIPEVGECVSVIFRACFFHYCISTLNEAGQVVRRERGLPNERGPKARQCNKHSALLHKHTFYKSLKTSATVTHASAGTGLALTRQQAHAVYVSGGGAVDLTNLILLQAASSFTHPHVLSNHMNFLFWQNTNEIFCRMFLLLFCSLMVGCHASKKEEKN